MLSASGMISVRSESLQAHRPVLEDMVIPLRSILYGIPILVVGVLAALPFRRDPQPAPAEGVEQQATSEDWTIETIQEISAAELDRWDLEQERAADPMQSLAASMPPIPDSYQAVALPLERPSKIAERFSAVARDNHESSSRPEPLRPLVGHPAALASSGIRRSSDDFAQSNAGWRTAIPIGRPLSEQAMPTETAGVEQFVGRRDHISKKPPLQVVPTESSSTLPPPRPNPTRIENQSRIHNQSSANRHDSADSQDPWPTLAELASIKEAHEAARGEEASTPAAPRADRTADETGSATGEVAPASNLSELTPESSIRGASDDADTGRRRFFIREPATDRG